jgi:hypothetical protein
MLSLLQSREELFDEHDLDIDKKYICYSGDDETTSIDQYYLEDGLTQCVV